MHQEFRRRVSGSLLGVRIGRAAAVPAGLELPGTCAAVPVGGEGLGRPGLARVERDDGVVVGLASVHDEVPDVGLVERLVQQLVEAPAVFLSLIHI